VRADKGPRTRLRAEYGTQAFKYEYDCVLRGEKPVATGKAKPNTLKWLIERYMESAAWAILKVSTRRQRGNIFKHIIASAGDDLAARISKKTIQAGIDRRHATPDAARHFLLSMRGLFRWGLGADLAATDPTDGIKVKRRKTEGYKIWPDEWCAKFEAHWPLGTIERVWYEVIHCTGLRRGDAVRVGRPHIKNNRGMIRAEKNDETAYFLISERLQRALDAGPTGDLTFIVGKKGKPLKKESFGNAFGKACRSAGVQGSAHGIRKTRATIEAEKGASGAKLDALFGWKTGSNTSAIYIRNANRAKLAFGDELNVNNLFPYLASGAGSGGNKS